MDYKLIFPCHEISSSSLFSFLPPLDWLKFNLSNFPQFTTLYFLKAKLQSSKKYFFYISSSLMVDLAISTGFKNYVRMMQEFWLLTSVEEMSSWNFSVDKNKGQSIFLKLLFAVLLTRSSVPVLNRKKMCRWPHLNNTRAKSAGLLNILNQKKSYLLLMVRSHFTRLIFLWQTSPVLNGSHKYEAKSNGMTKKWIERKGTRINSCKIWLLFKWTTPLHRRFIWGLLSLIFHPTQTEKLLFLIVMHSVFIQGQPIWEQIMGCKNFLVCDISNILTKIIAIRKTYHYCISKSDKLGMYCSESG